MSLTRIEVTDTTIAEVSEKLASVNADLDQMPGWKRRTQAGLDRLAERQRLLFKLDRLRDQARREVRS